MRRFKITKEGHKNLKDELNHFLNIERPAISEIIGKAIDLGDLSENEEYATAKDRQRYIENMISVLSEKLEGADIIDLNTISNEKIIDFGANVELLDLKSDKKIKYRFLSELESDINKNILSIESLIGRSLQGKKVDDEIEIETHVGIKEFKILTIDYKI